MSYDVHTLSRKTVQMREWKMRYEKNFRMEKTGVIKPYGTPTHEIIMRKPYKLLR